MRRKKCRTSRKRRIRRRPVTRRRPRGGGRSAPRGGWTRERRCGEARTAAFRRRVAERAAGADPRAGRHAAASSAGGGLANEAMMHELLIDPDWRLAGPSDEQTRAFKTARDEPRTVDAAVRTRTVAGVADPRTDGTRVLGAGGRIHRRRRRRGRTGRTRRRSRARRRKGGLSRPSPSSAPSSNRRSDPRGRRRDRRVEGRRRRPGARAGGEGPVSCGRRVGRRDARRGGDDTAPRVLPTTHYDVRAADARADEVERSTAAEAAAAATHSKTATTHAPRGRWRGR